MISTHRSHYLLAPPGHLGTVIMPSCADDRTMAPMQVQVAVKE